MASPYEPGPQSSVEFQRKLGYLMIGLAIGFVLLGLLKALKSTFAPPPATTAAQPSNPVGTSVPPVGGKALGGDPGQSSVKGPITEGK